MPDLSEVTLAKPGPYFRLLDQAAMAHWWGRSIEYVERRWLQQAMRQQGISRSCRVDWLDLGCGTGIRLRLWGDWACWNRRVGIEPEAEAVEVAALETPLEIHLGGLPDLPDTGSRYGLITAFDVLQHVPPDLRGYSVRSIAELLTERGILLMRTNAPATGGLSGPDDTIVDPGWLRRCLADAGLKVIRASRFNLSGGLAEDLSRVIRRGRGPSLQQTPYRTGLPESWKRRPGGHVLAGWCGFVESRILGTGLVNFPLGHSYLVMAIRDGDHDRSANDAGQSASAASGLRRELPGQSPGLRPFRARHSWRSGGIESRP